MIIIFRLSVGRKTTLSCRNQKIQIGFKKTEGLFFSIVDKENQYNSKYRAAAKNKSKR